MKIAKGIVSVMFMCDTCEPTQIGYEGDKRVNHARARARRCAAAGHDNPRVDISWSYWRKD